MDKQPKRPRDPNQLAKLMIDIATEGKSEPSPTPSTDKARKAGIVGGPARAKILSPERRKEIAQKAATTRWKKELVERD